MKKKVVYLALQSQLESFLRDRRVACIVIHRIEKNGWIPFIDAEGDVGSTHTFSIRVKKGMDLRVWSDLGTLIDWIDGAFYVSECLLSLSALEWEVEPLKLE
ncbi:hypothetical protein [Paraburkholderia humisilvae]|uniref:Uncharacterized protein n=1 Tax=Paraburkholderia humisilvae TaxID=627669 RepID=A0A6J5F743_9BURK|nr:hypothetical protein [Paraburkholderia humisilvae]CAB3774710.1 hypothetical protein LMG29542_08088 [Paraburkholderia humisilvae]